ncbi:MAG: NAD-dependent deacylase [Planctomycetota bacterium]|nr:NAD-dependent deacylase [Planctomycetota bacterium]
MQLGVVVLTGAGVSADSGLSTFRGPGGLWEGRRVEDVATPAAWAREPELVWRFYQMRRAALSAVEPNPAHRALADLERRVTANGGSFTLVTQNVDDLHERAGSEALLHMHGELVRLLCESCGAGGPDMEHLDETSFVPCVACGFPRLRPDIVWFGEVPYRLEEIEQALSACTHFLAVGTSGVVYPAAGLLQAARSQGALTWVNSLEEPENLHPDDTFLVGSAAEVVPRLVDELCAGWGC